MTNIYAYEELLAIERVFMARNLKNKTKKKKKTNKKKKKKKKKTTKNQRPLPVSLFL